MGIESTVVAGEVRSVDHGAAFSFGGYQPSWSEEVGRKPEFEVSEQPHAVRASLVRARLENGPLKGEAIEVEFVEARPPKTIEVSDEQGARYRYCLSRWAQEGATAMYTFLYPV